MPKSYDPEPKTEFEVVLPENPKIASVKVVGRIKRVCKDCGTSWEADVPVCPECESDQVALSPVKWLEVLLDEEPPVSVSAVVLHEAVKQVPKHYAPRKPRRSRWWKK